MFKCIKNILISFLVAFVILTCFCNVYNNTPVHHDSLDGATDYVWDKDYSYMRMTEGFGYGKTNNEGYMNLYDYDEDTDVEVLIMGSSHMENQFIPQKDNCANILNNLIDGNVYNIGTSGHNFKVCVSNLDAALNKYRPKYVVIETQALNFDEGTVEKMVTSSIPDIKSNDKGIIGLFQKNSLFRQAYSQLSSFISNTQADVEYTGTGEIEEKLNVESTERLIKYLSSLSEKYQAKVIILYHPIITGFDTETIYFQTSNKMVEEFNKICDEHDISFIDMSERYLYEYKENTILAYGFSNTSLGEGHLNIKGHKMIANEIYKTIKEGK